MIRNLLFLVAAITSLVWATLLLSLYGAAGYRGQGFGVFISEGMLFCERGCPVGGEPPARTGICAVWCGQMSLWGWMPETFHGPGVTYFVLPLWVPGLLLSACSAWLCAVHVRAAASRGMPLCSRCKYDLFGNVSGRCPECGTLVSTQVHELATRGSTAARIPTNESPEGARDNQQ